VSRKSSYEDVDEVLQVTDEESFEWARRLHREEGIFAGISSGGNMAAAARVAAATGKQGENDRRHHAQHRRTILEHASCLKRDSLCSYFHLEDECHSTLEFCRSSLSLHRMDGTFHRPIVVKLAKNPGFSAISLTDHDTIAGIARPLQRPGLSGSTSFQESNLAANTHARAR